MTIIWNDQAFSRKNESFFVIIFCARPKALYNSLIIKLLVENSLTWFFFAIQKALK